MSDNIVNFIGPTRLDIPADRVLEQAIGKLETVVLAGFDKNGTEYFASSIADGAEALWLLERCKLSILMIKDECDESSR